MAILKHLLVAISLGIRTVKGQANVLPPDCRQYQVSTDNHDDFVTNCDALFEDIPGAIAAGLPDVEPLKTYKGLNLTGFSAVTPPDDFPIEPSAEQVLIHNPVTNGDVMRIGYAYNAVTQIQGGPIFPYTIDFFCVEGLLDETAVTTLVPCTITITNYAVTNWKTYPVTASYDPNSPELYGGPYRIRSGLLQSGHFDWRNTQYIQIELVSSGATLGMEGTQVVFDDMLYILQQGHYIASDELDQF